MKLIPQIILLLSIVISFTGCVQYTIPGDTNRSSNYMLTTDDFKIIGVVEAEGETRSIFFVTWGGNGFSAILNKAKEIGGDDIINYHFDVEITGIINIMYSQKWRAQATVIKYTHKAVDRKLFSENMGEKTVTEKGNSTEPHKRDVLFGY